MALPYPIPDPATGQWDAFALKQNLEYLDQLFRSPAALSQFVSTVLLRGLGAPYATVESTAVETTVFSSTILGDTLGTNRTFRFTLSGDVLNDTGVDRTFTTRVKYGGTTFMTGAFTAFAASATRRGWISANNFFTNTGSATQQFSMASFNVRTPGVAGTSVDTQDTVSSTHSSGAVNSAAPQTFAVTIENSFSSASLSVRVFAVLVELL